MRKLKGFTLVEILIVIVIIGILIGALVPRMQSAQGRARDVARKNDLLQLQSAIVTSYTDRGEWPTKLSGTQNLCTGGCSVEVIDEKLIAAGLNGVPTDPIKNNKVRLGSKDNEISNGYGYMITTKNGVEDAGFVLMAHTEVEGGSNWVYCASGASDGVGSGLIKAGDDLRNIVPCSKLTNDAGSKETCSVSTGNECHYGDSTQLRYIMVY